MKNKSINIYIYKRSEHGFFSIDSYYKTKREINTPISRPKGAKRDDLL